MKSDDLRNKSDDELAQILVNKIETSLPAILVNKEFERRAQIAQHKLDLQLLLEQVRWMKFTAIIAGVMTLIGAIAGAILSFWLQGNPKPQQARYLPQRTQQETSSSSSGDRTGKALSNSLDPPLKKAPNYQ